MIYSNESRQWAASLELPVPKVDSTKFHEPLPAAYLPVPTPVLVLLLQMNQSNLHYLQKMAIF